MRYSGYKLPVISSGYYPLKTPYEEVLAKGT